MAYTQNKCFIIPDNVWWYEQCWTYAKEYKLFDDGIYIQAHSVFFDYSTYFNSIYLPFIINNNPIKLTQHKLYIK